MACARFRLCLRSGPPKANKPKANKPKANKLDAAALADQLVRLDDLLGPLLGVLDHRLGQAVGLELVRVMAAELAPVSFDHFLVGRIRGGLQHPVGLLELQPIVGALLGGAKRTSPNARDRLDVS